VETNITSSKMCAIRLICGREKTSIQQLSFLENQEARIVGVTTSHNATYHGLYNGVQDCIKIRQKLPTTILFRDQRLGNASPVAPSSTLDYSFDSTWDAAVASLLGRPSSTLDYSFDSAWDVVVAYHLGRPS